MQERADGMWDVGCGMAPVYGYQGMARLHIHFVPFGQALTPSLGNAAATALHTTISIFSHLRIHENARQA